MSETITPRGGSGTDQIRYAVAPIRGVEFRDASANHDGSWTISGYAAVFDQETALYDGQYREVRESIARGAFDGALAKRPLVHLNFGHDMNRSVASTDVPAGEIGSLTLTADDHGLRFFARVDREDPDAQALAVKMKRGVVRQASFAFDMGEEAPPVYDTADDGRSITSYRIETVRNLYDVCCAPQGAYGQTEVALRTLGAAIGQPAAQREATIVNLPPAGGENVVTLGDAGQEEAAVRARRLAVLRMQAQHHFPTKETA